MKGILLNIKGHWAQFRRAETNNNPLSHDFITKTALIGMMGAVLGKSRKEMKLLFPQLSEDLKYGVQINGDIKKQSWGFTFRSVTNAWDKVPKQMELLKEPDYDVILCLLDERSEPVFDEFVSFCKGGKACFEPILGLHNCPAEILFKEEGKVDYFPDGEFETTGFVSSRHSPEMGSEFVRLGFDKIPSFQNDDFWNLPDKYVSVIYPSAQKSIKVKGEHYIFNKKSSWCLI